MKRADREVTDREAIDDILRRAEVLHLAMCADDGPYVVPVNFGYDGTALWVHCAEEGRKLDVLAGDPRVCFETCVDVRIVPGKQCGWAARYRSVVGRGIAVPVSDPAEKSYGLGVLIAHYSRQSEVVPVRLTDGVVVVRIDISSMTGKAYTSD